MGWYMQMMHVVIPVHPDKANQTQHPSSKGSVPVMEMDVVISHCPKGSATILLLANIIMGVMARDSAEGVMGLEPFVELASWCHSFPVDVAFAATKNVSLKLSLESMKIMDL